jgi:hypothetical protein
MVPKIAEALTIRSAVSLSLEKGLNIIILVPYYLSTIQQILSPIRDRSMVGVKVEDIKTLATTLLWVTFHQTSRLCNNLAHTLAHRAENFGSVIFCDFAPDCIRV